MSISHYLRTMTSKRSLSFSLSCERIAKMKTVTRNALLFGALLIPALSIGQILGRAQEMPTEPTKTPRSFFRRAQATPAAPLAPVTEQEVAPTKTPAPRKQQESEPVKAKPKPPREAERTPSKEAAKPKETPKPKEVQKPAAAAETTPKPDAATLARDKDISDTLKLVTEFLKAAHHGHYAEASRCLTPAVQKYFEGEHSALGGGLKRVLDTITRDGTIRNVTSEAVLRGDGARVEAEVEYEDGVKNKWAFELLRTKEGWRIELDVPSVMATAKAMASAKPAPAPAVTPVAAQPTPPPAPPAAPETPAPTPQQNANPTAPAATPQSVLSDAPWKK
jgi:hypothetical protein